MDSDRSDRQQANSTTSQALRIRIRRDPDGVLLRGYYPGPDTATIVSNKAAYRCAVCLAAQC